MTPLLLAALSAAPTVGVHVSLALKVPAARQDETLAFLEHNLTAAGLAVRFLARSCQGDEACVLRSAREAGLDAVVLVTLGPAGAAVAVDLDALRVSDAARPVQSTFRLELKPTAKADQAAADFANALRSALERQEPPAAPIADAPTVEPPLAPPVREAPLVIATPPPAPSRLGPLATGGLSLAAAAVSLGFGVAGMQSAQRAWESPDGGATAAHKEAEVIADLGRATSFYSVSFVAGGAAVALAVLALVWGLSL